MYGRGRLRRKSATHSSTRATYRTLFVLLHASSARIQQRTTNKGRSKHPTSSPTVTSRAAAEARPRARLDTARSQASLRRCRSRGAASCRGSLRPLRQQKTAAPGDVIGVVAWRGRIEEQGEIKTVRARAPRERGPQHRLRGQGTPAPDQKTRKTVSDVPNQRTAPPHPRGAGVFSRAMRRRPTAPRR